MDKEQSMVIRKVLMESRDSTPERVSMFFKTGPGSYSEHDQFIGISNVALRKIAKKFSSISLDELSSLINSGINEERLLAVIILSNQYKSSGPHAKEKIYQFYIKNLSSVNNWNLVDNSAHLIIGAHLMYKDRTYLEELAISESLWYRRISVVSTWYFIRNNDLDWTFKIVLILLNDKEDLIHKAAGWMLREAGKRDKSMLAKFLDNHANKMPRTMLRYAIEKIQRRRKKVLP